MRTALTTWLVAAAIAGYGCTQGDKTQVLTGRLTTHDAVAVRAIDGTTIVTAARVRSDGTFTLLLPKGHRYRLEVLTQSGVHNLVGTKDGTYADVAFKVCEPQDPFDMGGTCDPNDPNGCKPDGTMPGCDPMSDPSCMNWPPPCPSNDPNCGWPCMDPNDPNCKCTDPMDPSCQPPPCDPTTDPGCMWPCNDP